MENILLVEDHEALARGIAAALRVEDREVTLVFSLKEAEAFAHKSYDLCILDINLPDGNGMTFLRRLRAEGNDVPVILLTANDLEMDEVNGLEAGADDYITKPFSLAVLRARVEAQLRKARAQRQGNGAMVIDDFSFDFYAMAYKKAGRMIELSRTEQRLLRLLVENRGRTMSRQILLERIWSEQLNFVEENALSVTMKRLRDKLEDDPSHPRYLKTVYGIGYTWAVT